METTESDVGYPEEQPPEVDDTPARGHAAARRRQGQDGKQADNDDGKATGNPDTQASASLSARIARSSRGVARSPSALGHEAVDEPCRAVHRRGARPRPPAPRGPTCASGARASVSPSV